MNGTTWPPRYTVITTHVKQFAFPLIGKPAASLIIPQVFFILATREKKQSVCHIDIDESMDYFVKAANVVRVLSPPQQYTKTKWENKVIHQNDTPV